MRHAGFAGLLFLLLFSLPEEIFVRDLLEKAALFTEYPFAVAEALFCKRHHELLARAGDANVGEPAFLLDIFFLDAGAVRQQFLLHANKVDEREFQSLGCMQCHERDAVTVVLLVLAFEDVLQHEMIDDLGGLGLLLLLETLQPLHQFEDVLPAPFGNLFRRAAFAQDVHVVDLLQESEQG